MLTVELIYDLDCPNVRGARGQLLRAFVDAGVPPRWQEWDRSAPESPAYVSAYGSPTILINGQDVAGSSPSEGANCCRIYLDENGRFRGVPSVEAITSALLRANGAMSSDTGAAAMHRSSWRRVLAVLPGIGAALLPNLTCPACWPAYAGLFSLLGLGFFNYTPYLFPLTVLATMLAVTSLGYRAEDRRGYKPLLLGILAAVVVIVGKFALFSDVALYGGITLLVGVSLWNSWPRRGTGGVSCPACVPAGPLSDSDQGMNTPSERWFHSMEQVNTEAIAIEGEDKRERLLRVLSAATFLIFFQAYMVAPLIPRLSAAFMVSGQTIGLIVPAYMIPYGVSILFYSLLSDRLGRRRIMLASLLAFVVLTALTATAQSASQLILWRFLTGLGASGVVPLALALMGALFPYERRGRPLGWLFGAMAGGMAFGSTVGVVLEPFMGWRMLFVGVAVGAAGILGLLLPYRSLLGTSQAGSLPSFREVFAGYRGLLGTGRGVRTYGYVFWNGIFHSGVFTWLGLYFARRYGMGEVGIGLALLGYGVPGFLLGPIIGRVADRWGRRWLVPTGLGIGAIAVTALVFDIPLLGAALAVTALSLSYDMTQPLLAGIVTALGGKRGGQAMGLNVFALFTGFGIGSLLFGAALHLDFGAALAIFSAVQLIATVAAIPLFISETPLYATKGAAP